VEPYVKNETFLLTYGDGVSDVNINSVIDFHKKQKKICTVTAVQNPGKFGSIATNEDGIVNSFMEKPKGDGSLINAGFFVLSPKIFDYLEDDTTIWEQQPLQRLASDGELMAYEHQGFWQPMDTLRDKTYLDELWSSGSAPWKTWL